MSATAAGKGQCGGGSRRVRRLLALSRNLLFAVAAVFVFRAVGFTLYTIGGDGLSPLFVAGDRVLVNRWSYGLRVGGGDISLFGYGRLWRQKIARGDVVAFENPTSGDIVVCRCQGLPGDTLNIGGECVVVPSIKDCADADYYWVESVNTRNTVDSRLLGFISEEYVIGRVVMIVWSHNPASSLWKGWDMERSFVPL